MKGDDLRFSNYIFKTTERLWICELLYKVGRLHFLLSSVQYCDLQSICQEETNSLISHSKCKTTRLMTRKPKQEDSIGSCMNESECTSWEWVAMVILQNYNFSNDQIFSISSSNKKKSRLLFQHPIDVHMDGTDMLQESCSTQINVKGWQTHWNWTRK